MSVAEQAAIIFIANEGYLNDVENKNIQSFKKQFFEYFEAQMSDLVKRLNEGSKLEDTDKTALIECTKTFKENIFKV